MRARTRRTGGPGDVGVAGQTPASTIHAEERARHALARTVTQYAARSWLPVASTIRACTHGNRSAGGTGAPYGQHNSRVCARSNLRASSTTSSAFKHNPLTCARGNRTSPANPLLGTSTIREFAHATTLGCGDSDTTAVAQSTLLRARQPHQSRQSVAWYQHNPRVCEHSNLRASSATSSAFKHNPRACTHGNRTGPANPPLAISTIRTSARTARWAAAVPTPRL